MKLKKFFLKVLYSRLLVICLSVLILFVPIIVILVNPDATSASTWFDDSWAYRREVDISGNTALLTNFQVKITAVNTQTLFNEGKLQFNCQDIRFVDRAGNLLPYWIVDKDLACGDSTSTDFWVRMPRVEVGGTKIYMYYGNQLANAYSSGANTFNFFSDLSIQQAPWYNSAWGLRQKFTIAKEMVRASTLTDFPVYLDLSLLGTEFFDRVDADGDDIVITAADGVTKLSRELVDLDKAQLTGELWFKATTLMGTDDNIFYIYYGNPSASETNDTATWSNGYVVTQHFEENPEDTPPQFIDSSGNGFNGTANGSMTASQSIQAKLGKGLNLDGSNDYIGTSMTTNHSEFTISGWVRTDDIGYSADGTGIQVIASRWTPATRSFDFRIRNGGLQLAINANTAASAENEESNLYLRSGELTYVAATYNDATNVSVIYKNLERFTATTTTSMSGAAALDFGRIGYTGTTQRFWDGLLDNMTYSSTARSVGWLNTEYLNQSSPDKYFKVESSEIHKSSDKLISGFELNGNIQINNNGTITLSDASNTIGLISNSTFATSSRVLFRASQSSNTLDIARLGFSNRTFANNFNADDSAYFSFTSASGNWIRNTSNEGTTTTTAGSIAENTVARVFEIAWRTGNADFIVDNTSAGALTTNVPDENMNLRFETSNTSDSVVLDWIAVGQHATSIPTTVVVGSEVKSQGPILWLKLDETEGQILKNYGTAGSKLDGYLGTAPYVTTSDPLRVNQCVSGNCLKLDGVNDIFQVDHHDSLNIGTGDFTVSMWIMANDQQGGTHNYAALFIKSSSASAPFPGMTAFIDTPYASPAGRTIFRVSNANELQTNASALDDSKWRHYVFMRESNVLKIFINGVLDNSLAIPSLDINNTAPIRFGSNHTSVTSQNYDGFMDEIKLYDRAITTDEVLKEYNSYSQVLGTNIDKHRDGLLAWWKFDEGLWNGTANQVRDASGNNFHGTATNGAVVTGNSRYGNSGSFDGTNDYVNFNHGALNFGANDSFTVSAWVKANNPTSGTIRTAVQRYNTGTTYPYVLKLHSDNTWQFAIWDGTNNPTASSASNVNSDWHHLVGVRDKANGTLSLYLDGVLVSEVADTTTGSISNAASTKVGIRTTTNIAPWNGLIDDVRIYRTALDKKAVEELYSFQPDAIAHWKLDEKEGTTANDSSLNNLHGTLQNMSGNEWQEGKISKSLRFDGTNDYVSVPDNDLLDVAAGGSFSIATWFKTDGTVSSDSLLVGKGGLGNSIGYSLYLDSTGKVVCGIDDDASSFPEDSVVSTAEYDDSEWHHALCVKDNSNISLYINGTSEGTPDTSLLATGSLYNSSPLTFAGNSAGLNFSGQMDDVRYWNYPITSTDFIEELAQPESSFISTLTQSTEKQTTQDLAVHYKLDSKSGVTAVDSSTNSANGTLNNTTDANWVRGKVGGAINLNGSDQYVSTADSSLFDWSNQITVSAWFKTSTAAQRSLVGKMGAASNFEFHLSVEADGRVRCLMSTNGTTPSTLAYSLSGHTYVNGQWNFATCVYNGSNIRVTVNGLPGTAVNFTGNIFNGTQPLTIGGNPSWGGSWMFNGSIDNVKIWKRALTVREIALEYNGGAPSGYWKFDEGSGTTAFDHSGNGLHATLLNTTPSTAWLAPTNCKYNGCHEFDGTNDYATTSTSAYLNPPQELTLSTWVKFTKTYVGAGNDLIFGKDFTSHTDPFYHYRLASVGSYNPPNVYYLSFFVKTSTVTVNRQCGTGANYWNNRIGEWMHLVGTYDAQGTLKFYIDGQLICSHTGGGLIANYNTGLNFARYRNVNTYVPVVLDETKHFTYALTEEDVKREYHSNGASLLFK